MVAQTGRNVSPRAIAVRRMTDEAAGGNDVWSRSHGSQNTMQRVIASGTAVAVEDA